MKKRLLAGGFILLSPMALLAQGTPVEGFTESIITPHFFIAILAGVLLALGFQFILTALSVALGITAIGDLKESYVENKYKLKDDDDDDDDDGMDTGTMITTGFGLWSVITVGLSLFGATALAINLSLIANSVIAITLGLVIWATFFILLFYLESKLVNTLVGGLINTATAGLRASGEVVKGIFTTSKEKQIAHVAEDTVDKIRKDLSASFDPKMINETIDEFFKKLDKRVPDYEQVKNDIKEIVKESDQRHEKTQKKHGGSGSPGKWIAINNVLNQAITQSSGEDAEDKSKVEKLKMLQKDLKEAYDERGTNDEKLEKVIAKLTPAEEEQVHEYIEKIKGVISSVTPNDMKDGKGLQDKVMQVVKDPTVEGPKLVSKLGELDRETIIRLLEENTVLERRQIEQYADKIEEVLNTIKSMFGGGTGEAGEADFGDMKMKLERTISGWFGNNGQESMNFGMLTSLFQSKLDDQGSSVKSIKRRIQNFDKDSLVAAITSNTSIDQRDIDKVVQSYDDARNNVLQKIQKVEDEANRRMENLKRRAVIQAEHARKNAAAAAWWLVISAILSAGAAIGGSLLALS